MKNEGPNHIEVVDVEKNIDDNSYHFKKPVNVSQPERSRAVVYDAGPADDPKKVYLGSIFNSEDLYSGPGLPDGEKIEERAKQAMLLLDALYNDFVSDLHYELNEEVSEERRQELINNGYRGIKPGELKDPVNWYDFASRATAAGIFAAREIINTIGSYREYNSAESAQESNSYAQVAFSKKWKDLGLPPSPFDEKIVS